MRSWLGIAVALVIGLVLGTQLQSDGRGRREDPDSMVLAGRTPNDGPSYGERPEDEEQRRLLRELVLQVETLRTELRTLQANRPAPSAATTDDLGPVDADERTPVAFEANLDPELVAWMRRIDAQLENLAKSPGSLPVLRLPPVGHRPTPLPVPAPEDEDQSAFGISHLLWTYQDVIDAYGRPDIVHDGEEWEYKYKGEVSADSGLGDIHIQFSSGLVVGMYAH